MGIHFYGHGRPVNRQARQNEFLVIIWAHEAAQNEDGHIFKKMTCQKNIYVVPFH